MQKHFRASKSQLKPHQTAQRSPKTYRADIKIRQDEVRQPSERQPCDSAICSPRSSPRCSCFSMGLVYFSLSRQMNLERKKGDRQFRDISHTSASVQINELSETSEDTGKSTNLTTKKIKPSLILSLSPGAPSAARQAPGLTDPNAGWLWAAVVWSPQGPPALLWPWLGAVRGLSRRFPCARPKLARG